MQYTYSTRVSVQSSEMGPPLPTTRKQVCLPWTHGGGANTLLRVRGVGGPNSDDRIEKAWHSVYSVTSPLFSAHGSFIASGCEPPLPRQQA